MNTRDALKIAQITLDALPALGKLLGIGGDKELAAARDIVGALQEGVEGKTSPQVVLLNLESLVDSVRDTRATTDAAADAKFGPRE